MADCSVRWSRTRRAKTSNLFDGHALRLQVFFQVKFGGLASLARGFDGRELGRRPVAPGRDEGRAEAEGEGEDENLNGNEGDIISNHEVDARHRYAFDARSCALA